MRRVLIVASISAIVGAADPARADIPPAEQLARFRADLDSARKDPDRSRTRTDGEQAEAHAAYVARANAIAARAIDLGRTHPADPAAFDALIFVIREVRYGAAAAMRALAADYLASPRLIEACRAVDLAPIGDSCPAEAMLRAAQARSPHREVRGFAAYFLARNLKARAEAMQAVAAQPDEFRKAYRFDAAEFARFRGRPAADLEAEAGTLYEAVIDRFGDLPTKRAGNLGRVAAGELFNLRHLSVGRVAPEVEGRDVDGRPLKLSDHRGKVVVVTFGGDWCGSCKAMYPQERALVERHKDRPFALLSVMSDKQRATLAAAIESREITWPCWWDESPEGPIAARWGIDTWPSIFVLDPAGVIRARDVREAELDRAVDDLLRAANP